MVAYPNPLISHTFSLSVASYVQVSANLFSFGTGRRDTTLQVDGVVIHSSVVDISTFNIWGQHTHSWTGLLPAGMHTIRVVAGSPSFQAGGRYGGCFGHTGNLSILAIGQGQ
jgi:hypothetical protein